MISETRLSSTLFSLILTCVIASGIGIALLATADNARAHSGATGVVKERMDGMKDMSKKSKAVVKMFRGQSEYDSLLLIEAADSFVIHAEEMIELFPDNAASRTGTATDALPEIWEDWDKFAQYVEEFKASSVALQSALAENGEPKAIEKAFKNVSQGCRQCHKAFRKAKK